MSLLESNFNGIQHVGVPVSDLACSRRFYERLGFVDVMGATFVHGGEVGNVSMMKRGAVIMELYQMPERDLNEIRERKDGHIDHVTFDVCDIDKAFNELKGAGFEIVEQAPVLLDFWENGCKYFNVLGPDGERLEFNQIL